MERRYDEGYKNTDDRSFDDGPVGYGDETSRRRGNRRRRDPYRGAVHPEFSHDSPDYYDYGGYGNRGYQGEGYFGQSYAGSYPNMPYGPTNSSQFERGFNYAPFRDFGGRGWWPKTRDEVARWFGDEGAERRRQRDERREAMGGNRGKGPKDYRRSDDRIKDDVSDLLWDSDDVDASNLEVKVENCEVTLTGTVPSRYEKRCAEDIAESVWGVTDVMNLVRIEDRGAPSDAERREESTERWNAKSETNRSKRAASGG
ncbi:MAG TPA: BON domain-containing protein [Pyrinomonadaceae bacterium]